MLYATSRPSPLGSLTLASDGENIVGLWIEGQKYFAATRKGALVEKPDLPVFSTAGAWLDAYFSGEKPAISAVPLAPEGSGFRKMVWDMLRDIPYGQCVTYGEIARKSAAWMNRKRMAGQAVGGAVGHNPISIIIPCHRVVGANGGLTGYAGGLDRKAALLEHEGVAVSGLFVSGKGAVL